jgi:hypothetical protein
LIIHCVDCSVAESFIFNKKKDNLVTIGSFGSKGGPRRSDSDLTKMVWIRRIRNTGLQQVYNIYNLYIRYITSVQAGYPYFIWWHFNFKIFFSITFYLLKHELLKSKILVFLFYMQCCGSGPSLNKWPYLNLFYVCKNHKIIFLIAIV